MYCYSRPLIRSTPQVVSRSATAARNASYFPLPLFSSQVLSRQQFPLGVASTTDFAPFLRLLDDAVSPFSAMSPSHGFPNLNNTLFRDLAQSLSGISQPRFDVKEIGNAYELQGEVPGVIDLQVEFPDSKTLVIRGNTRSERSSGERDVPNATNASDALDEAGTQAQHTTSSPGAIPASEAVGNTTPDKDDNDAASVYSTGSYQKPSVEEADDLEHEVTRTSESQAAGKQSLSEELTSAEVEKTTLRQSQKTDQNEPRYWYKERNTGSFKRIFKFENAVDVDSVQATLSNGILNVNVPKTGPPTIRRIAIQ